MAKAEPTVGDLEAELIAAKEAGDTDGPEYRDLKLRLREARRNERLARSGVTENGDAAVNPDTVTAKAEGQ